MERREFDSVAAVKCTPEEEPAHSDEQGHVQCRVEDTDGGVENIRVEGVELFDMQEYDRARYSKSAVNRKYESEFTASFAKGECRIRGHSLYCRENL